MDLNEKINQFQMKKEQIENRNQKEEEEEESDSEFEKEIFLIGEHINESSEEFDQEIINLTSKVESFEFRKDEVIHRISRLENESPFDTLNLKVKL